MERNNGRYTYIRRPGGGSGQQQQHNQHYSSSSISSTTSSSSSNASYSSSSNNGNSSTSLYNNTTNANNSSGSHMPREPISQHDELIRYIREAWTKVNEQNTPVINESDHQLKNFKPFNLEEYWGQRLVQNIHISHGAGGHQ